MKVLSCAAIRIPPEVFRLLAVFAAVQSVVAHVFADESGLQSVVSAVQPIQSEGWKVSKNSSELDDIA
jgi:hypothetical protein